MQSKYRDAIMDAHAQGLGNREIARIVGCHHSAVKYNLNKLGLVTNNPRGRPPEYIDKEYGRCNACQEPTRWEEFALVRSRDDGRRLSQIDHHI